MMIELAITVTDQDIAYVRAERKWWAARDQDTSLDKKERKEAQRWVKVCTLVLESMYGTKGGKEGGEPLARAVQVPLELQDKVQYLYMQATSDHLPYADLMDQCVLSLPDNLEQLSNRIAQTRPANAIRVSSMAEYRLLAALPIFKEWCDDYEVEDQD